VGDRCGLAAVGAQVIGEGVGDGLRAAERDGPPGRVGVRLQGEAGGRSDGLPDTRSSSGGRAPDVVFGAGVGGEVIEISVRRALLGYVLQRLSVDTTVDHSLNPSAYQLMLLNRDEIEPFAAWAFR
jgi:hypothetical protein